MSLPDEVVQFTYTVYRSGPSISENLQGIENYFRGRATFRFGVDVGCGFRVAVTLVASAVGWSSRDAGTKIRDKPSGGFSRNSPLIHRPLIN